MNRISSAVMGLVLASALILTGCASTANTADNMSSKEQLAEVKNEAELYEAALKEDTLIVYTVSTRITKVKEAFEKAYPGLSVEVRDLRSPDLVEAVWTNYDSGSGECDVVVCNDNSGSFYDRLVKTGAVVPYVPDDIRTNMEPDCVGDTISFLIEADLFFYNTEKYEACPISNIWELTDPKYEGKIYVPNPLRSFSTYALFGSILDQSQVVEEAYTKLYGRELNLGEYNSASELFLGELSKNVVFTNSSDEVYEALGTTEGKADFGIMVSSKLRMQDYGYSFEAITNLEPFCGCKSSYSVMLASRSKNVNAAKLFIWFLLGGSDGTGEGYKPFLTKGTWSARTDVINEDAMYVPDNQLLIPDPLELSAKSAQMDEFFERIIKK
ncbi:MAG: extracellular solute-binding protein [Lachnospiraceae bacterium]|nr:extracellular solute-binding protein [Candidatus Merdinaster equi]